MSVGLQPNIALPGRAKFEKARHIAHAPGHHQAKHGGKQAAVDINVGKMQNLMATAEQRFSGVQSRAMARDADVNAHEQAHQSAGGHLSGGINLVYATTSAAMPDGTTRTVSFANEGSVPLAMPGLPGVVPPTQAGLTKLQSVRQDFSTAKSAAEAPGYDLSSADSSIASRASGGMSAIDSLLATTHTQMAEITAFQAKSSGAAAVGADTAAKTIQGGGDLDALIREQQPPQGPAQTGLNIVA